MTTPKWFIVAACVCFAIAAMFALSLWTPAAEKTPGGLALFFTEAGLILFAASYLVG